MGKTPRDTPIAFLADQGNSQVLALSMCIKLHLEIAERCKKSLKFFKAGSHELVSLDTWERGTGRAGVSKRAQCR